MAIFNFLTPELSLFIAVMIFYSKVRKTRIFPLKMVRDLTVYLVPTDADFEVLRKSSIQPRESMTGKKNKYDSKRTSKQARFPMRTMPMGDELLKYCNEEFTDYDFLFMLFVIVVVMYIMMSVLKVFAQEGPLADTNLTFYLTLLALLLFFGQLGKDSFKQGYFQYSEETKVRLLYSAKSFVIVWVLTSYTSFCSYLGFDLPQIHQQMNLRINDLLKLSGGTLEISSDFTCLLISLMCAVISFLIVKINVSFAYFFFVFTRSIAEVDQDTLRQKDVGETLSFEQIRNLLFANFLAPLFVVLLFIDDLLGSSITGFISIQQWHLLRLVPILVIVLLRGLLFRNEVQFQFDQSYLLISKMMTVGLNEKVYPYIRAKIALTFNKTWDIIIQQAATVTVPVLLILLFAQRALTFSLAEQQELQFASAKLRIKDDKTFELFNDKTEMSAVFNELVLKGIFSGDYQLMILNFALFWYFASSFLVSSFALLYYRKFRES